MIGNGMAGVRVIEELLKINSHQYEITIFGKEPHPNYNRIQLSNILQGETSFENTILNDLDWYKANQIQLFTGEEITSIDPHLKLVYSNNGKVLQFDELIIATGPKPFILPIPGAELYGVVGFRDIEDCVTIMETAKEYKKAVVIGGGLLGLEAAKGLLHLGMEVDVVHLPEHLMEKQLDAVASNMLRRELAEQM